jgi:hypothetical protein
VRLRGRSCVANEASWTQVKLKGTVRDAPDGTVLLEASALFVTPKKQ